MVELVKGISKLPDRRLEADRPRHSIQFINDDLSMITLSRVARGSFLIGCSVNVMTSVPVWVPSSCTGSEASSVRTGQWGSPICRWVFVNFCVHEMSDVE
ncbi:hypothetical protein TNCV_4260461 [Trichonephila clavipes]|nr:hypothetical protein TNCV_4260461 [Trichonephila clavipes]